MEVTYIQHGVISMKNFKEFYIHNYDDRYDTVKTDHEKKCYKDSDIGIRVIEKSVYNKAVEQLVLVGIYCEDDHIKNIVNKFLKETGVLNE